MKREPGRLAQELFDVLVIGGGISGATLAWDCALRGLKVALVDKGDFGHATTSATSKLIHGGLRYLKNGELGIVRESLRERRILQLIAPHLVEPLAFLVPTYRRGGNLKWMIRAGLILYDWLSWDRNRLPDPARHIPAHTMLSPPEVLSREPDVLPLGLTGGAIYRDCRCEPERLCLEFVLGAAGLGAVCVNYATVNGVYSSSGHGAVEIQDRFSGQGFEVRARVVVNAAGPWVDEVDGFGGMGQGVVLRRSKGIHLVTRPLTRALALVMRTSRGGHFFIIPWQGRSLIGTTDVEYLGPLDELSVTEGDVEELLAEVNRACPRANLTPGDVLYRYAGVRPLVDTDSRVYSASRRYEILEHDQPGFLGWISAIGGKYTTSRSLAEKIADRVEARLGKKVSPCRTASQLLPGGVPGVFDRFAEQTASQHGESLPQDVLQHLIHTYGARSEQLVA